MNIFHLIMAAVSSSFCLIGSIACMAAPQRKDIEDIENIVSDKITVATDYEKGKLVHTKDAFSSEDSDDYIHQLNTAEGGLNLK